MSIPFNSESQSATSAKKMRTAVALAIAVKPQRTQGALRRPLGLADESVLEALDEAARHSSLSRWPWMFLHFVGGGRSYAAPASSLKCASEPTATFRGVVVSKCAAYEAECQRS
eukprot:6185675-Pleurochrysis_carterae.AAC.1